MCYQFTSLLKDRTYRSLYLWPLHPPRSLIVLPLWRLRLLWLRFFRLWRLAILLLLFLINESARYLEGSMTICNIYISTSVCTVEMMCVGTSNSEDRLMIGMLSLMRESVWRKTLDVKDASSISSYVSISISIYLGGGMMGSLSSGVLATYVSKDTT